MKPRAWNGHFKHRHPMCGNVLPFDATERVIMCSICKGDGFKLSDTTGRPIFCVACRGKGWR